MRTERMMNTPSPRRPEETRRAETSSPLRLMVVYGDSADRSRARRICEHLTQALEQEFDFETAWCGFGELEEPETAAGAAEAATAADLVLFCTQAAETLPLATMRWLEYWLPLKPGQDSALVALIGQPGDTKQERPPVHGLLRELARLAGMGFLSPDGNRAVEARSGSAGGIVERESRMTTGPSSTTSQPGRLPPHWGINE